MENFKQISESLAQFNNITLSKTCWLIILKGLGLPTGSIHFWTSFRNNCLVLKGVGKNTTYTLIDMSESKFREIWNEYCKNNRASVKKVYDKKKKAKEFRKKTNMLRNNARPYYVNPDGTVTFIDSIYNHSFDW